MLDSAAKENLSLFGEVLNNLRQTSLRAFDKGRHFLPLYHTIKIIHPFLDNAILYCNQHLNAHIPSSNDHTGDLFAQVAKDQYKIKELYSFLQQNNYLTETHLTLDADRNDVLLGNLLHQIDKLPSDERDIQCYFMRGIIESAAAVAHYGRRDSEWNIADDIDRSDIPEQLSEMLQNQGISITEDDEDSVYDVLYQECGNFVSSRQPIVPQELSKSIAHTLQKYFAIDEKTVRPMLDKPSESLCQFIRKARSQMKKHQAVIRHLTLFSQNFSVSDNDIIEQKIYSKGLPKSFNKLVSPMKLSNGFPDYLQPYLNTPEFIEIQRQKPTWEAYEKESKNFKNKDVEAILNIMSLSIVKDLYRDFDYFEDILNNLSEQKDDEEEDQFCKYVSWPQEQEVLTFAHDLLTATDLCAHFSHIDLNNTGVTVETIQAMQKKNGLSMQDINILGELFDTLENDIDEAADIINLSVVPDYQESWNLIKTMPHGLERQKALTCLFMSVDLSASDLCDELESILFDIDSVIGHSVPAADDILTEFLSQGKSQYSDLDRFNSEDLAENIHQGVLASYVVPMYSGIDFDGSECEAALEFIEGYEYFEPQTKKYLSELTRYYADKIVSFQKEKPVIPEEIEQQFDDYKDCHFYLRVLEDTQDEVDQALAEEKKITLEYNKYKQQKEVFELPENTDLLIASMFYRGTSQSL